MTERTLGLALLKAGRFQQPCKSSKLQARPQSLQLFRLRQETFFLSPEHKYSLSGSA